MSAAPYAYVGSELELFEQAVHWKAWIGEVLTPYLRGEVLEVGAGIGGTTPFLLNEAVTGWCCLEPDPELAGCIAAKVADGALPARCTGRTGTLAELPPDANFDAIAYLDVLEHIEDDTGELRDAAARLRPGGHLIVLGPAWPWLTSPFDEAIGHHRRYTRASLSALAPPQTTEIASRYLDAAGLLASAGNRLLLRSAQPSAAQIRFWDRRLVPLSRRLDPLLGNRVGKSVLVVWRRH